MSDVDYSADVSADTSAAPSSDGVAAPDSGDVASPPSSESVSSQDDILRDVWKEMNSPEGREYRRDEYGRFVQKQQEIDQALNQAQEQGDPALQAPNSWSADARAIWDQLPPGLQQEIAHRDSQTQEFISRQGNEIGYYRGFANVWEHGRQAFNQLGWNDEQAMHTLVDYANHYANDPFGAIHRLAQDAGIDLYQALGVTPQHGVSPDFAALYAQNNELQSRLNRFEQQVQWREQQEQHAQVAALENQVVEFSRDKPDFEQLAPAIIPAIEYIKSQSPDAHPQDILQWAYDAVRWAIPEAREQQLQAWQKEQEQARVAEAQKRAKEARNGQALHVRSSPANMATPKSMDDTLREAYRRATKG
jgi:hypothetical protein